MAMGTGGKVSVGLYMLSAFSIIMGIEVKFQQQEYEVARGDPVDLTCTYRTERPNSPTVIITWLADADEPTEPQISIGTFYHPSNELDISAAYEGIATMANDVKSTPGVTTLSFSRVTMQENRIFQCTVQIPGDNDGQPSDVAQLVVLVAPTVPVCRVQGAAEYGQNINLTCKSEEGSPTPTYKWERFDPRNIPQPFPPRTVENNGVLSLFNVSMETSGYYICTATNKIRSASYNMTLTVMPPSLKIGSTAGIIGGCAAGLVILLVIVYCCCCRKKKKPTDYEMEEGPAEFHDKPPLETEKEHDGYQYGESLEVNQKQSTGQQLDNRSDHYDNYSSQADDRQGKYHDDDRYEGTRSRSREQLDRYDDSRSRSNDRLDRYDDARSRSSDRLDRYDDSRSRSSDRLDRYDDSRGRSNDRLDRYDDSRGRSNDRRDRYDDNRRSNDRLDRYDDNRSRSSDRLDRYDDNRSRSSDRLDRYEGSRDHYDDRSGRYEDRRDYYDDQRDY